MWEEFFAICLDMALHNILKVSSANVQGIRDKRKQIDVLSYLLVDSNILCLQDTHLTPADVNSLMLQFLDHEILVSGSKTNSRGIAVFLQKKFEYKIEYKSTDQKGNLILLDLQLGEISLRLLNVYAPNIDNPVFFMKIREYMEESSEMYTLLRGNLNLVLDPKMYSWCLIPRCTSQ